MDHGATRLGRAAGAASLTTFIALALHVLAGGHAASVAAVAASLLVATAVAAQLAGRPLGRWRLAAILAVSQAALHTSFTLGDASSPPEAMHGGHAAHAPAALAPLPGAAAADAANPTHAASMPVAHVLAAVVTYVAIRRAHVLLSAIAALGALLARAVLGTLDAQPTVMPAPHTRIVPLLPPTRAVASVTLACRASRAPPAFA